MSDTTDEGGDPACWAHLFDDDRPAEADQASPSTVAPDSLSSSPNDDHGGPA